MMMSAIASFERTKPCLFHRPDQLLLVKTGEPRKRCWGMPQPRTSFTGFLWSPSLALNLTLTHSAYGTLKHFTDIQMSHIRAINPILKHNNVKSTSLIHKRLHCHVGVIRTVSQPTPRYSASYISNLPGQGILSVHEDDR